MKAIVNRAAFHEALGITATVAASRTPKPILQCVRLSAVNDALLLAGTDLEVGIRYNLSQVEISEGGEAVVPADKLAQIAHESTDETLSLEVTENVCHIRGRDSHFQIYGQDPAEFPPVAELEGEPDLQIEGVCLSSLIAKTVYAAARENTRYAINGVLWERRGKRLALVATDGRRLARAQGPLARAAKEVTDTIVPIKCMRLLTRVLDTDEAVVAVKLASNQIVLRCGPVTVSSVLVEGHFPKYEDVIPRDCDKKLELDRRELLSAVSRAALLTSEESKGVRMRFADNQLVLSSRVPDEGEATITMSVSYSGQPLEIGFNPGFLVEALRVLEADTVGLELKEPNRPGVLRAGEDFLYVVMPVSLS